MRVAHSLLWKSSLVSHKLTMKSLLADHQSKRITQLECLLDTIYTAHNSICALVDRVGADSSRLEVGSPRARIVKPFNRSTVQRKTIRKMTERPRIDMSKLKDSFGSFADAGEATSGKGLRMKKLEMNLQMQTDYNGGLQAKLHEREAEMQQTQLFLESLQLQIANAHKQEREQWLRFFEAFKANCERELLRKQEEVAQLNRLLGAWVTKFMNLQEIVGIPSGAGHRRRISKQYEDELKQLCDKTSKAVVALENPVDKVRRMASRSPLNTSKTIYTRMTSQPTQLSAGDTSPILDDF